ncbi:MAG: hypothetical protein KDC98_00275 [Planctomycetes bacterium]|nr:hypothetical protein [Planctomycetota bacterium]
MKTPPTSAANHSSQIRGAANGAWLLSDGRPRPDLGGREVGERVTDHASSWVRKLALPAGVFYVKTYEYKTWRSRWSGLLRHTGPLSRSRAAREFDALLWFGQNAPPAAIPIAAFEWRYLGVLERAILITAACPGERVDELLARTGTAERESIGRALGHFVGRIHALGARDGNLDLRNLLAIQDGHGHWRFAKIDSPRFRLRRPGRGEDRWSRADWRRLLPQLAPFGIDAIAQRAGREAALAGTGR